MVHRWFDGLQRDRARWRQLLPENPSPHTQSPRLPAITLPRTRRGASGPIRERNLLASFHKKNLAFCIACSTAHDRPETTSQSQRQQIDIIRLLVLTGCRKNEIIRLRRQEVTENCLRLIDSKTGPRTVFLNSEARAIIERRMAADGEFLFPSPHNPGRPLVMTFLSGMRSARRPESRMCASTIFVIPSPAMP